MNLVWMPLFFGLEWPILATVDVAALAGTVGYLTYIWGQVDEVAGWALAPYVAWLCFATYLSAGCGYLNNWDFSNKRRAQASKPPPGTRFVDEKP
jgi:benzodiazapine receptor